MLAQVTFTARAHGMRFFFEEPSGVTVYRCEKGNRDARAGGLRSAGVPRLRLAERRRRAG